MDRTLWRDGLVALAICVLATLAFHRWHGVAYSGDDLQYAGLVREAVTGEALFHPAGSRFLDPRTLEPVPDQTPHRWVANPRYPLETLSVIAWSRLRNLADPIHAVQEFRAFCGGLALCVMFLGLGRLRVSRSTAALATASLAASHAFWDASTRVDYSITAVLAISVAVFLSADWLRAPSRAAPPVGVVVSLATAALFNLVTLIPGTALMFAGFLVSPTRQRLAAGLSRSVGLLVLIAGTVISLAHLVPTGMSESALWRGVVQGGVGAWDLQPMGDLARAAAGFARAFVAFPGVGDEPHRTFWRHADLLRRVSLVSTYSVVLSIILAGLAAAWIYRKALDERRGVVWALTLSTLLVSLSNWAWEPGHTKFWVLPLFLWWLTLALVLDSIPGRTTRSVCCLAMVAFGCALGTVNGLGHFRVSAEASRQPWLSAARQLAAMPPSTLFVSAGHPVDFHIVYFARRNVVATELVWYAAKITGSSDPANVLARQFRVHAEAGGPILMLETMGEDFGDRYCWPAMLSLAGPPRWSGFGLVARELAIPESELSVEELCR